jgi:hypothetical protein
MVVLPGPPPVGTGFGDAVIVAADAAGLGDGMFASGFFEELHAAKKHSHKRRAAVGMNRFIVTFCLLTFLVVIFLSIEVSNSR